MYQYTRYQNRKLYDRQKRRYIIAPDLLASVREGNEVQIICHRTKNDITEAVLSQAVGHNRFPKEALVNFIRSAYNGR